MYFLKTYTYHWKREWSNLKNCTFKGVHSNGERRGGGGKGLILQASCCPSSLQPVQGRRQLADSTASQKYTWSNTIASSKPWSMDACTVEYSNWMWQFMRNKKQLLWNCNVFYKKSAQEIIILLFFKKSQSLFSSQEKRRGRGTTFIQYENALANVNIIVLQSPVRYWDNKTIVCLFNV